MGFFSLGYFFRSFRWVAMLRFMEMKIPLSKNLLIYFTGYAFTMTPGKLGEAVRSKYLKDKFNLPPSKTLPTVFSERYYDVIGVLAVAFLSYGTIKTENPLVFLSAILLVVFYFGVRKRFAKKILSPLSKVRRLGKLHDKLIEYLETVETLMKPKIFAVSSAITIFSWFVEAIGAYFIFEAFGINLGLSESIFTYVITSLIGAASFLPGGVGGTEGSLLGLLLLKGHNYNDVLGPVLMIRVFALWYVIIIGIFFTFLYRMTMRKKEEI
jgi:uncharacterized protein (TIRG00374 family)